MPKDSLFQVKLGGDWKDYDLPQHRILLQAYLAGFPNASYTLRDQRYEVDFKARQQKNLETSKVREIRPPYRVRAPPAPIVPAGRTMCVTVPAGSPGSEIQVPHPDQRGQTISVAVPATAKVGQPMLVPIPSLCDDGPPVWPSEGPMAPSAPPLSPVATDTADAVDRVLVGRSEGAGETAAAVSGAPPPTGSTATVVGAVLPEDGWGAGTGKDASDSLVDAGAGAEAVKDKDEDFDVIDLF
jgi:hypothetical protein